MSKTVRALALATPLVTMALFAAPASAGGQQMERGEVAAHLAPVPGNGVEGGGYAQVEFDGHGQISAFELQAHGLLADAPHAAHLHYGEQARHECPGLGDDTNYDGHLNTTEGAPAYGPVQVSLTTSGDTTPASVLAIDRYDTATHGTIAYEREEHIATSAEVAAAIANGEGVVVSTAWTTTATAPTAATSCRTWTRSRPPMPPTRLCAVARRGARARRRARGRTPPRRRARAPLSTWWPVCSDSSSGRTGHRPSRLPPLGPVQRIAASSRGMRRTGPFSCAWWRPAGRCRSAAPRR
jgi:hypothetical protein